MQTPFTSLYHDVFEDILSFWFRDTEPSFWFKKNDAFDALIRERFEAKAIQIAASFSPITRPDWLRHTHKNTAQTGLALIIALDQFPRNMYRDTSGAFAWDSLALRAAIHMINAGEDLQIPQSQRAFIYMPLMHAEDIEIQNYCVSLIDQRIDDESTLYHAKKHRDIIEQFGRFPYRNDILGRQNTDAETLFLKDGGYRP